MALELVYSGTQRIIYRNPDGSLVASNTLFPEFGLEPCGDLASCVNLAGPSYGATQEQQLAELANLEDRLSSQLSLEARSQLTFLPASVTPLLGLAANAAAYTGGLVPLLEGLPGLGEAINAQAARVDNVIEATTVRDPRDGKTALEQYLDNRDRSASIEADPAIIAEKARLAAIYAAREAPMGLLDDLGLTGFASGGGGSVYGGSSLLPDVFGASTPFASTGAMGGSDGGVLYDGGGGTEGFFGGLLNSVIGAAPSVLQAINALADSGIIRGSVGSFFNPQQSAMGASQAMSPANVAAMSPTGGNMPTLFELLTQYGTQYLTAQQQQQGAVVNPGTGLPMYGPAALAANAGCGRSRTTVVNAMSAPGIFNINACGKVSTTSRIIAERMDGQRDLLVKVGTINSPSPRTMQRFAKKWAKQAGLTVGARGRGRARRVYRRRRPR